jgi:hypothetical protein
VLFLFFLLVSGDIFLHRLVEILPRFRGTLSDQDTTANRTAQIHRLLARQTRRTVSERVHVGELVRDQLQELARRFWRQQRGRAAYQCQPAVAQTQRMREIARALVNLLLRML